MNNSLRKIKARLDSKLEPSKLVAGKDPSKLVQTKEQKSAFVKQTEANFVPKQAGRDWWWCDDV